MNKTKVSIVLYQKHEDTLEKLGKFSISLAEDKLFDSDIQIPKLGIELRLQVGAQVDAEFESDLLERACKAVCIYCKSLGKTNTLYLLSTGEWRHQDLNVSNVTLPCAANAIRQLGRHHE